jgi:diguanylate cyclase (GGDEF)-like protein
MRLDTVNLLDDPVVSGLIVVGTDVTELDQARSQLEHVVRHDGLTGLPNRSLAVEALRAALRDGRLPAVVHVDLDRFKPVNDLMGHRAGDEVLQEAARRLAWLRRTGDVLARVGGDEFVLVVPDASVAFAEQLADRIEAAFEEPFVLRDGLVQVGASVGVAVAQARCLRRGSARRGRHRHGRREGGAAGRGAVVVAAQQPAPGRPAADGHRQRADPGVPAADRRAHSGVVAGVEALARWVHPVDGIIPPADFLDLADDTGLAGAVGDVILASACRSLAALPDGVQPSLALNLSVQQLTDPCLPDRIAAICDVYDFALERLHIEITEQAALERKPAAGHATPDQTLRALHALGCKLVLDDFGTGYSSLTHVRRFPLHTIKVDRLFVIRVRALRGGPRRDQRGRGPGRRTRPAGRGRRRRGGGSGRRPQGVARRPAAGVPVLTTEAAS